MMKRFKIFVCCILTLVLMFTVTAVSVLATDSKTVSVTVTKTFTCSGPEISGNIQSIQSSTYSYDDGSYRGVLSNTQINYVTVVPVGSYFQVTVTVTYSGTVTSYSTPTPVTKSVNITANRSFTCEGPQINANMQSIQSSTYYYDDGAFRGTLNFSKISYVTVTVVGHGGYGDIYRFDVQVDYSGTVTSYN